MSWIKNLYDTYDANISHIGDINDPVPLLPLCHTIQNAHIQVFINSEGNFLRAFVVQKDKSPTIIPCTESSASRAGKKPKGHPLCDSLQFVAGDFVKYGGKVTSGYASEPELPHKEFLKTLNYWCNSSNKHSKVISVLEFVKKGTLVEDLVAHKILFIDSENKLLKNSTKEQLNQHFGSENEVPVIFNVIQPDQSDKTIDQGNAFVRWCVETPGNPQSEVWSDPTLWKSWANFYAEKESAEGLCYVLGEILSLGKTHPKRIRRGNDNAKLISIPSDKSFLTFQGRFTDDKAEQASGLSFEVSQKAHNALRWLIGRNQAFKNGDQVIVSWAITGEKIPNPFSNSFNLFNEGAETPESQELYQGDTGQSFAQRLKKYIAGYSVKLGSTNRIVVLGLDSASTGRLSITYYRELTGSEFLTRIEKWHSELAWKLRIPIEDSEKKRKKPIIIWPICAPALKDIAQAAYVQRIDDKLKKTTVERLLPCIIDGAPVPLDLVKSCLHRACNRVGLEHWDWETVLGIACALYKGYYLRNPNEKRSYSMGLETERTTRDYLYGRLLAAADLLESVALHVTEKNRPTTATRFMQRFSDRPYTTWRSIELALSPYRARLKARTKYDKTITEVTALFAHDDFISDKPLSGEFLLGYHCQREAFNKTTDNAEKETDIETETLTDIK